MNVLNPVETRISHLSVKTEPEKGAQKRIGDGKFFLDVPQLLPLKHFCNIQGKHCTFSSPVYKNPTYLAISVQILIAYAL